MIIKTVLQANTCLSDVYVHANLFSSSSSIEIHVKLVYLIKFHPSDVHVKFDRISVVFFRVEKNFIQILGQFYGLITCGHFQKLNIALKCGIRIGTRFLIYEISHR